jgi:hypothetical protein
MNEIMEIFSNNLVSLEAGHGKERVITERRIAVCVDCADAFDNSIEDDLEVGSDIPRNALKQVG